MFLAVLLLAGCGTGQTLSKNDNVSWGASNYADSVYNATHTATQGAAVHHTTHVYDSVFTHVTIYRYDTLTQKVIEKIIIEQEAHHADNSTTTAQDSARSETIQAAEVHTRDTLQYSETHEQTIRKPRLAMRTRLALFLGACGLLALLVVFLKIKRYI